MLRDDRDRWALENDAWLVGGVGDRGEDKAGDAGGVGEHVGEAGGGVARGDEDSSPLCDAGGDDGAGDRQSLTLSVLLRGLAVFGRHPQSQTMEFLLPVKRTFSYFLFGDVDLYHGLFLRTIFLWKKIFKIRTFAKLFYLPRQ